MKPFTLNFVFGNTSKIYKGDPINTIFLYIKQYIYNNRCFQNPLSLPSLKERLKYMYILEKEVAVRNKSVANFQNYWNIYENILS